VKTLHLSKRRAGFVSAHADCFSLYFAQVTRNVLRGLICLNEEERRKHAHDREAIAHLKEQLRGGDKSLVGNKG
jgi:hypothetical protein